MNQHALCSTCLRHHSLFLRRGQKLSQIVCPICKTATLAAAVWTACGWAVKRRARHLMKTPLHCGVCGRRYQSAGKSLMVAPGPFRLAGETRGRVYPAGTKLCRQHATEPAEAAGPVGPFLTTAPLGVNHGQAHHPRLDP